MNKLIPILSVTLLAGCVCDKPKCPLAASRCADPVMGNWSADLPYDTMPAGSFIFSRDANGAPQAFVLYRWGSPEWVKDLKVCGSRFAFNHPYGYRYEGCVQGDRMIARIAKETGVKVSGGLYADALSSGAPAGTYADMFRYNVRVMSEAMK